jgi:hypothetical protein
MLRHIENKARQKTRDLNNQDFRVSNDDEATTMQNEFSHYFLRQS